MKAEAAETQIVRLAEILRDAITFSRFLRLARQAQLAQRH